MTRLDVFTARRYARGIFHGPVSVCVSLCLLQVGVLSKQQNGSSWFWHERFLRRLLHCVLRKFGYLQKIRILPSGTLKISPRQQNSSTVELVDGTYVSPRVVVESIYCYMAARRLDYTVRQIKNHSRCKLLNE